MESVSKMVLITLENFLQSARKEFTCYKTLGEKVIARVPDDKLFWQYNEESNIIRFQKKNREYILWTT